MYIGGDFKQSPSYNLLLYFYNEMDKSSFSEMGNLTSKSVLDCRDPTSAWKQLKHSTPVIEHNTNPQNHWTADKIRFVHISDTHSLTSHIE